MSELAKLEEELRLLRSALESVEKRLELRYTYIDVVAKRILESDIKEVESEIEKLKVPPPPKWEMIQSMIAIYSVTESPPPKPYLYRYQGFYNVDALRNSITGKFRYDTSLTRKEIGECLIDFRIRWGWKMTGEPARGTSEPMWIETSEFEFVDEPKGAELKTLSKLEDEAETYWETFFEVVYTPSESEKEEMKREET